MPAPSELTLDAITTRIRVDAGADFAFILTRKGRLLTRDAPPQMPEIGRVACVTAAREAIEAGTRSTERTMPREHLVPYGGAAPVDVFVAPCGEAIVCVVLATWTDASQVGPSLDDHLPDLEQLLLSAKADRAGRRGKTVAPPPPRPQPEAEAETPPEPLSTPPRAETRPASKPSRPERSAPSSRARGAKRASETPPAGARRAPTSRPASPRSPSARPPSMRPRALSGLVELSKSGIRANEQLQSGPTIRVRRSEPPGDARTPPARSPFSSEVPLGGRGSLPAIEIGEQSLGRESLAAIEADGRARGSLPEIEISEAPLGRESLAAIEADGQARGFVPRIDVSEVPKRKERPPERRVRSRTPTEIEVGSAMLGRASVEAIELDELDDVPTGSIHASAPDLEVNAIDGDLGSIPPPGGFDRATQPWTESPEETVRATRAAKAARGLSPPEVEIGPPPARRLEAMALRPPPPAATGVPSRKKKQNSNVDLFRQALGDMLEPSQGNAQHGEASAQGDEE